jgi:hypothetical protein
VNCTRQDMRRQIDFSAVRDPEAITRVIAGLLSRRKNPMRQREIERWFHGTPAACIGIALTLMVGRGQIEARMTGVRRGVLEYSELANAGWDD